jgi:hypothetical protein
MAQIIPALARRCHTVASVSRCRTPPRSISSSRRTAWGKPRSSSEGLIHLASRSRASRRDSGHGSGNHFNFSASSPEGRVALSAIGLSAGSKCRLVAGYRSEIASPLRSALAINPTCRPDSVNTAPFSLRSTIARAPTNSAAPAPAPP